MPGASDCGFQSRRRTDCVPGDLVPTPHHLAHTVLSSFDDEPERMVGQKQEVLADAEKQGWLLVFAHGNETRAGYWERGRGDMGYLRPVEI